MLHRTFLISLLLLAGPAAAAGECGSVAGIEPLLRPGRILLLGEIHGTRQAPMFALDVVCHAARAGLPVVLGLELPTSEQAGVDTFLATGGPGPPAGAFWQSSYQDGRASRAMFDLIDGVRRLRSAGHDVVVSLFDPGGAGGGQRRDRGMAQNLAEVADARSRAMLVVLTGNYHSRITSGIRGKADFEPMGQALGRLTSPDRLVALNMAHAGGTAWVCAPDCGVVELTGRHGAAPWSVEIDDATRPAGHSGWYHVGSISASPPAKATEEPTVLDSPVAEPPPARTVPRKPKHGQDERRPLTAAETDSIVISAPQPGSVRPTESVESSGSMMRLLRTGTD